MKKNPVSGVLLWKLSKNFWEIENIKEVVANLLRSLQDISVKIWIKFITYTAAMTPSRKPWWSEWWAR